MTKKVEIWVTSDLHLGHRNIIYYEPLRACFSTIEEHDQEIEDRWRATVKKDDVVYVLGDVAFGLKSWERFRSFPGRKKLIMGNHERSAKAIGAFFCSVHSSFQMGPRGKKIIMTHIPIHVSCLGNRFSLNVHGHTHGRHLGERYVNACVENHEFSPINLRQFI